MHETAEGVSDERAGAEATETDEALVGVYLFVPFFVRNLVQEFCHR